MKMRILVALDESRWAAAAATTALRLAGASPENVEILAVHVIPVAPLSGVLLRDLAGLMGFEPVLVPEQVEAVYRKRGEALLERFAARAQSAGVSHRTLLESGNVVARLCHHAADADLVIAGVRGENEEQEEGTGGSTLERLVKRCPVSLIAVGDQAPRMERVAVGYDGSAGAQGALKAVRHIGEVLPIQVEVLTVGQERGPLDEALADMSNSGLPVQGHLLDGEAHEALGAAALENGADLLALGYRGRSWLSDVLLGRVTEYLLGRLPVALLVAR